MNYQNRQVSNSQIDRAVRHWAGDSSPHGDDAAGVQALTRELANLGMDMTMAARAAAIMHSEGITFEDRWTGPLQQLGELGSPGIVHHRAMHAHRDRHVEIDIGRIYHIAITKARMLRRARAT